MIESVSNKDIYESDDDVIREIIFEYPGIIRALNNRNIFKVVKYLSGWFSQRMIWSMHLPHEINKQSPIAILNEMRAFKQSVYCDGAAYIFKYLLDIFNIPAITFSYTSELSIYLSHAAVIYYDSYNENGLFYLFDPYLQQYYSYQNNNIIIDFHTLLKNIIDKKYNKISVSKLRNEQLFAVKNSLQVTKEIKKVIKNAKKVHCTEEMSVFRTYLGNIPILGWLKNADKFRNNQQLKSFLLDMLWQNPVFGHYDHTVIDGIFFGKLVDKSLTNSLIIRLYSNHHMNSLLNSFMRVKNWILSCLN